MAGTSSHSIHKQKKIACQLSDRSDASRCTKWYQWIPYASLSCVTVLCAVIALHNASEPGRISSGHWCQSCMCAFFFFLSQRHKCRKNWMHQTGRMSPCEDRRGYMCSRICSCHYNVLRHLLNLWESCLCNHATTRWHRQADIDVYAWSQNRNFDYCIILNVLHICRHIKQLYFP